LCEETASIRIGFPELMVVLAIALVIFGPSKLLQLGEGLGKAIKGFNQGLKDEHLDGTTATKNR